MSKKPDYKLAHQMGQNSKLRRIFFSGGKNGALMKKYLRREKKLWKCRDWLLDAHANYVHHPLSARHISMLIANKSAFLMHKILHEISLITATRAQWMQRY